MYININAFHWCNIERDTKEHLSEVHHATSILRGLHYVCYSVLIPSLYFLHTAKNNIPFVYHAITPYSMTWVAFLCCENIR